jgi:hypothetical protein
MLAQRGGGHMDVLRAQEDLFHDEAPFSTAGGRMGGVRPPLAIKFVRERR